VRGVAKVRTVTLVAAVLTLHQGLAVLDVVVIGATP
jgi:hypothetical protein